MFDIIITGSITLLSSLVSAWAGWFFARKKYNSEVDNNLIKNMKESLDFYERLSNDNKTRLEEVLNRNMELEQEVRELRKQLFSLMNTICTDVTCQLRKQQSRKHSNIRSNGGT